MKKLFCFLLAAFCLLSFAPAAHAEHFDGREGWNVTYTTEGKLESNFHTPDYNDPVAGLQPGDDITFTVTLESANKEKADWYMTNEVLHSLEDRSKSGSSGGAYSYKLVYNGPGGERILYDSDTVGGDDVSAAGVGLHEATSALKDYFYLDTLTTGQTGKVTLNVALDGESQGNRYQDTLADLQMNFAVESRAAIVRTGAARTGDASHLLLIWLVVIGGGIGALVLAVLDVRDRRRERRAVK